MTSVVPSKGLAAAADLAPAGELSGGPSDGACDDSEGGVPVTDSVSEASKVHESVVGD